MSKNTSFSLGDHFITFVDSQVKRGRYGSASDVVRAGLRLLEEQEAKLAALRAAFRLSVTNALMRDSCFSTLAMQRSRKSRGVCLPDAKSATARANETM